MKRNIVIASVAAAALITGGTAVAVAGTQSSSPASRTTGATAATTARASLTDAAHAALKAVPGTLDSIDRDHGRWEADVLGKDGRWHEVTLDADGKVIDQRVDRDDDNDPEDAAEARALRNADVSAVEAARKAASRGTVTSVEFDGDHTPVWEVETVKNHKERDLNVDPRSGKVTQAPADDDHGDDHGDDDSGDDD
ncbi:PepSY domain-containing protein [Streptomyces sp. 110]|uniref:PepSY domain-containing protein n=1 Tax=Streptomyces endocoffeicus TaxID=2898945 RepID=A0ABS1PM56_9ACTN|nr:PepSY domain-containing protein [Streptomyces endocoffeicus]MBL1113522.1 PepSY domain-containing protein [Streptomyces endocoffeicus]